MKKVDINTKNKINTILKIKKELILKYKINNIINI